MFRRTKADLDRVSAMIAAGANGEDVANRLTLEGMSRGRAEWLVRQGKNERRFAFLTRASYYAGGTGAAALIVALLGAWRGSEPIAIGGFVVFGISVVAIFMVAHYKQHMKMIRFVDWDPRGIVPEELAAPPPRSVRIRQSATAAMLAILAIGIGCFAVGVWQIEGMIKLRTNGIETRGRITSGKLTIPYTVVRYTYTTPIGRVRDSSIVPWGRFRRLNDRDVIAVTYLDRPWFRSRPFRRRDLDWMMMTKIAGFQIAAGLFLIVSAPYFRRITRRQEGIDVSLARFGSIAIGDVISYRMTFARVRYRFGGVENEASLRGSPTFAPQPGDRIVIVFDPADPVRSLPADSLNVEFI